MPHGERHRHAATISILPDDVFLEVFAFCVRDPSKHPIVRMEGWRILVHVCRRWRRIIYASPRYLDLHLCCSNWTVASARKILSFWSAFPVALSYHLPDDEDDVIAALEHRDRVRLITFKTKFSQMEKMVATMEGSFPVLTHLVLHAVLVDVPGVLVPSLPGGFLGGSAPCLQPPNRTVTSFISPEAMVAGLSVLTRLETLCINIRSLNLHMGKRRRSPGPPIQAVLPALTEFEFGGCR
ncbi:hypothetical protein EDB89DRAFT_1489700 [Lactarius sanguifluus]|nr:hypothetical protein EDB89DRAFT_1489700 [Lactarius sanguifluus]